MTQVNGKVVVVTGASRGLGRGMARQFGRLGATVYVTSRPSSETVLREAAAEVTAWGGKGVAVPVDHRDAELVRALVTRIREEHGRLDILVNNAAAVHQQLARTGAFWEKPLAIGDMIEVGLHTSYVMSYFAAPLMIEQRRGLIANISFYGAATYFHGPAYGAAKAGTDKMSFDMALDLRPHDVACVSLWPGFIYSDALAQFVASAQGGTIPVYLARHLPFFERPEFSALVLNALHDDPERMSYSGETLIGAELGERYGIRDIDGKQPPSYRAIMGEPRRFVMPTSDQPMRGTADQP
jgi:NAD(P)-dependent dehydrogenase (short-subunit alcohol dehydrogenase family)